MTDTHSTCAAIMAADSELQVVSIVRSYLASFSDEKAAFIPGSLIAFGVNHAREIAQAAVEVARREAQAAAEEAAVLKEIGTVLSTAAMKLVVLGCAVETQPANG